MTRLWPFPLGLSPTNPCRRFKRLWTPVFMGLIDRNHFRFDPIALLYPLPFIIKLIIIADRHPIPLCIDFLRVFGGEYPSYGIKDCTVHSWLFWMLRASALYGRFLNPNFEGRKCPQTGYGFINAPFVSLSRISPVRYRLIRKLRYLSDADYRLTLTYRYF